MHGEFRVDGLVEPDCSRVRFIREIRDHDESRETPYDSDDRVDNKQPPPARQTRMIIQCLRNSRLQRAREHLSHCLTGVIETHPFSEFGGCVPVHCFISPGPFNPDWFL